MPIKDWPLEDRPREKLIKKGEKALSDAELIAIFLKTGLRGKTAVDLARELLTSHGGLKALLSLSFPNIQKINGVGLTKFVTLKAALELGRRYFGEAPAIGETLNNSAITRKFISERLREYQHEVFACLFLDYRFRLICFEELFHGSIHSTPVYPREIVKRCLAHNAAKVILAHNHPSGCPAPSRADKEVTHLIKQALGLIETEVVDHVIIGFPDHFSFADAGLLS